MKSITNTYRLLILATALLVTGCATGPVPKPDTKQKLNDIDRYTVVLDFVRVHKINSTQILLDRKATEKNREKFLDILLGGLRKRGYEIGSTASSSGLIAEVQKGVQYYVMEESPDAGTDIEKEKITTVTPPFFLDEMITGDLALELRSVVDQLAHYNIQTGGALTIPDAVKVADRMGGNPLLFVYAMAHTGSAVDQVLLGLFGSVVGMPSGLHLYLYVVDPVTGELIWADGGFNFGIIGSFRYRQATGIFLGKLPDKGAKPK